MNELIQKDWPDYKKYRIQDDEFRTETSINSQKPNPWVIGFFVFQSDCFVNNYPRKIQKEKRLIGFDIY